MSSENIGPITGLGVRGNFHVTSVNVANNSAHLRFQLSTNCKCPASLAAYSKQDLWSFLAANKHLLHLKDFGGKRPRNPASCPEKVSTWCTSSKIWWLVGTQRRYLQDRSGAQIELEPLLQVNLEFVDPPFKKMHFKTNNFVGFCKAPILVCSVRPIISCHYRFSLHLCYSRSVFCSLT